MNFRRWYNAILHVLMMRYFFKYFDALKWNWLFYKKSGITVSNFFFSFKEHLFKVSILHYWAILTVNVEHFLNYFVPLSQKHALSAKKSPSTARCWNTSLLVAIFHFRWWCWCSKLCAPVVSGCWPSCCSLVKFCPSTHLCTLFCLLQTFPALPPGVKTKRVVLLLMLRWGGGISLNLSS